MDWLQTLLDNSSTPVWTAFLLGLLTALSPCPLATNIAAIGFIGKDIENRKRIFRNGLLYTLGRILSYTLLGVVLILILKEGSNMFGIQKTIGVWGELVLGPLLFLIGLEHCSFFIHIFNILECRLKRCVTEFVTFYGVFSYFSSNWWLVVSLQR